MKSGALVLSLSVFMTSALAGGNLANQICPTLSAEGTRIVSGIQGLQETLKKSPECQPISERLGVVNDVVSNPDWKIFKDLLSGDDVESLESDQIDTLTDLASRASQSLVQTIGLLSGSGRHCVAPQDKPSFLGVLSGVTKEVSSLVGKATGPYGMAISLGGNIISSAISGIDDLFKSGRAYNFYNKDEEIIFMNQFCSYVEAKKDVADFVAMDQRVVDLEYLDKYLDEKLSGIYANCDECEAYAHAYAVKKKADLVVKKIVADVAIESRGSREAPTFSRCTEIARAIHSPESDFEALMQIYESYENPLMSKNDAALVESVLEARTILKDIFPSLSDCWSLSQEDKVEISKKFNEFMRDDILHLNETLFAQQLSTLKYIADKKYIDPLGDYTAKSIKRKEWAKKEKFKVEKRLKDPNRQIDLSHIREVHEKLENRISGFLMPNYLSFLVNKGKSTMKSFTNDFYRFRKAALRDFSRKLGKRVTSLSQITEELKTNKEIDGRIFLSKYRSTFDKFDASVSHRAAIDRYCEYLIYTSTVTGNSQYVCETRVDEIKNYFENLDEFSSEIKSLVEFDAWANENLDVQSSRVRDYADMIREWNSRGAKRWRTKAEGVKQPKAFRERISKLAL